MSRIVVTEEYIEYVDGPGIKRLDFVTDILKQSLAHKGYHVAPPDIESIIKTAETAWILLGVTVREWVDTYQPAVESISYESE
jgi:hypothetical protein